MNLPARPQRVSNGWAAERRTLRRRYDTRRRRLRSECRTDARPSSRRRAPARRGRSLRRRGRSPPTRRCSRVPTPSKHGAYAGHEVPRWVAADAPGTPRRRRLRDGLRLEQHLAEFGLGLRPGFDEFRQMWQLVQSDTSLGGSCRSPREAGWRPWPGNCSTGARWSTGERALPGPRPEPRPERRRRSPVHAVDRELAR